MKVQLFHIAKAAHNVNRALCQAQGDDSQVPFDEAPEWQRASALNGVALHVANPGMSPASSHEAWLAQKTREGWAYGKVKDVEKKLHPCFLPYDKLPPDQKAKDYIFKAVVAEFAALLGANAVAEAVAVAEAFAAQGAEDAPTTSSQPTGATQPAATIDDTAQGTGATVIDDGTTKIDDPNAIKPNDQAVGGPSDTGGEVNKDPAAAEPAIDLAAATTDSASGTAETQPVADSAAAE